MALDKNTIDWFSKATATDLDQYEQMMASYNKPDKAEYMAAAAERRAQLAGQAQHEEDFRQARQAERATMIYELDKLEPYKSTPRKTDSDFVKDCAGTLPFFGKQKTLERYANASIVYTAIVQANDVLWEPGDAQYAPAVFVYTLDPLHMHDKEWLRAVAEKIEDLRDSDSVPDDCKELIKQVRNSKSSFHFIIGKSITGGIEAWCGDAQIKNQEDLPFSYLPSDRIVPMLLTDAPREKYPAPLNQIAGKYYR